MTTFKEMWSELQQPGKPMPFLLLDCAGIDGGAAQIPKYIFSEIQCLFVGTLATELADVAPYLGQLQSLNADVARTVENLMKKQAGILVVPKEKPPGGFHPSFSQLYRHFRKLNMIEGPDGKKLFFRYYDPRVLMKIMQVFDATQLDELFGPVSSFIVFGNKNTMVDLRKESRLTQPLAP
ncbi:MAG: DUF4123 domain-containing protein [Rhodoferax sp.]